MGYINPSAFPLSLQHTQSQRRLSSFQAYSISTNHDPSRAEQAHHHHHHRRRHQRRPHIRTTHRLSIHRLLSLQTKAATHVKPTIAHRSLADRLKPSRSQRTTALTEARVPAFAKRSAFIGDAASGGGSPTAPYVIAYPPVL
ncbi:hypothetical protein BDN70DRAFT_20808 [Pholiota conissans]|uniref:Uncharacterized protein n=1 Tax=Pholiota conissans TaxID=109636 RepID=A0A9P6CZL6_9AGAR|nr:hypothetical protein BDN70DRAFT_20808 [Pholiota conissans]